MNKTLFAVTLLVATLALTGLAAAQPPGPPPGLTGGPGGDPMAPLFALNLTGQQETALRALFDAQRDDMDTIHDQLRGAEDQLRALVCADTPDAAGIDAAADALSAAQRVLLDATIATGRKVAALLTPAQRARLRAGPNGGPGGDRRRAPR
ncbi:MAG: periplasmic heavy metal sensor [Acidobacteria bacterium]|nr:periplasmic heavy metal sensor [Acidobacteriota bacterium]